jgi:hypothetical protein
VQVRGNTNILPLKSRLVGANSELTNKKSTRKQEFAFINQKRTRKDHRINPKKLWS